MPSQPPRVPAVVTDAALPKMSQPPLDAAEIDRRAAQFAEDAEGAFAPATLAAYQSDIRGFLDWCRENGHSADLPYDPRTVAAFVRDVIGDKSVASVKRAVSALNFQCRSVDLPPPGAFQVVQLALKAVAKKHTVRQKQAAPLRHDDLQAIIAGMEDGPYALRDAALLSVAYDTLGRSDELVRLRCGDIAAEPGMEGGTAFIASGKGDQEGEGSFRFISATTLSRVRAWVDAMGLEPADPLFQSLSPKSTGGAISTRDVRRIFKARGAAAPSGLSFSGHSARVGAAQDARAAGLATGDIQQAGGWKSERMVARYTERLNARESAAAKLARMQGR